MKTRRLIVKEVRDSGDWWPEFKEARQSRHRGAVGRNRGFEMYSGRRGGFIDGGGDLRRSSEWLGQSE
ncbi:hypothetical protein M6B38_250600 [Iris pallida]|uniref:Uncharacterized protein n=1 Tax=Iris pallida TaxID=29817 RepID=A0AAX6IJJ4_IRIPA|nr:hypothetical protein M6B38_161940 [Iris pallida]KAJ6853446.1 hypothetical protein M6B38_250600 [Iris pallida]